MAIRVRGITNGARPGLRLVAVRITVTKPAVMTTSRIRAPMSLIPEPGLVTPAATAPWPATISTTAAAAIAPMTWPTM